MPVTGPLARGLLAAATAVTAIVAVAVAGAGAAYAGAGPRPLPAHVFAPYFQTYTDANPADVSQASGARSVPMAFIQTQMTGSCDLLCTGEPAARGTRSTYGPEIARTRHA